MFNNYFNLIFSNFSISDCKNIFKKSATVSVFVGGQNHFKCFYDFMLLVKKNRLSFYNLFIILI